MATKTETENFSLTRRDGVPASASVRCRISDATGSDWYEKLEDAADELPPYGHQIHIEGYTLFLENVVVSKSEQQANGVFVADLTYNQYYWAALLGGNPIPRAGVFSRSYTSSVNRENSPVIVEHTWPSDDQVIGSDGLPRAGKTETQNAQFNLYDAPRTLMVDVVVNYDDPGNFVAGYAGKLNSTTWQGGDPGFWRCVDGSTRYIKVQTPFRLTVCTFEFEYEPSPGHQQRSVARFIDPTTGLSPEGLVDGAGSKLVDSVDTANFNDIV